VRVLPPLPTPSPHPLPLPLLPLLLPLLPRLHLLSAVVTFLPTFVVLAALLLVVAGESVRPQPATRLLAASPVLPLLVAVTRRLAAVSVKSARHLLPLVADGSLLRAVDLLPASVSPSRALPRRLLVVRSTCRAGSALSSRV
jgi:hypothetical protein